MNTSSSSTRCSKTGGFPLELIREMTGETINYPCGHCEAEVAFDSARIEGAVRLMKKDDPALKGPFDVKFKEEALIQVEVPVDGGAGAKTGGGDRDVIMVIDPLDIRSD